MTFKWRKWNKAIHRDFGYFFFGMTLIYAISGIALNHLDDWDPKFVINTREIQTANLNKNIDKEAVLNLLELYGEKENYKKHYFPSKGKYLKVFIKGGTVTVDLSTGKGIIEKTHRRPLFSEMDYLHYNPIKYWTWFADIYAGALIVLAIGGIFIPRGKSSLKKRGIWLLAAGIIIPVVYLVIYFY
jgi:hypothetical protein